MGLLGTVVCHNEVSLPLDDTSHSEGLRDASNICTFCLSSSRTSAGHGKVQEGMWLPTVVSEYWEGVVVRLDPTKGICRKEGALRCLGEVGFLAVLKSEADVDETTSSCTLL